ncbi:hypothetical protein [Embleya sp. NPDC059259]|uniref:hypothetical protein n=1 Tax=unclassified Embleya TaxID=2699296 RepID=UPI0036840B86
MHVSHRDEVGEFAANAAALITRHWGRAGAAPTGDLDRLWDVGAVHGWFDLGDSDALAAAIALARALGRAACPLPVLDAFVAARLFAANTGLAGAIGDGGIRVVTALPGGPGDADAGTDCLIEAGDAATHVLRLPFAVRDPPGHAVHRADRSGRAGGFRPGRGAGARRPGRRGRSR